MSKGFWSHDISSWWLVPIAFAVATLVSVALFSQWFETHEGTAAWLQAIGLPFTITAAIYVSWRENKNALDREASRRRERSLAIGEFVAADYFNFRMRVELLWQGIQRGEFNESTPRRPYFQILEGLKLDVPESFRDALAMAIEADRDELKPCTNLIHATTMYNNYLQDYHMMIGTTPEQWRAVLTQISTSLDAVRRFCTNAWPFFAPDHPDPTPSILARLEQQET